MLNSPITQYLTYQKCILEAPELGMPRYKGQMFGSKWCLFHCSRSKVHGLLCNDYAVCGKPMYYYQHLSADCTPHCQHHVHIHSLWEVLLVASASFPGPKRRRGLVSAIYCMCLWGVIICNLKHVLISERVLTMPSKSHGGQLHDIVIYHIKPA